MKVKTCMGMVAGFAIALGAFAACGGDDEGSGGGSATGSPSGSATGTGTGTGTGSGTSSGSATGSPSGTATGGETLVHGCSMALAQDMTGMASVDLDWSLPHSSCILVDVGTVVNWNGNFTTHPLAGGVSPDDAMDLISMSDQSGMTASVTFDTAGDYPYFCTIHTTTMQGVVYVQ